MCLQTWRSKFSNMFNPSPSLTMHFQIWAWNFYQPSNVIYLTTVKCFGKPFQFVQSFFVILSSVQCRFWVSGGSLARFHHYHADLPEERSEKLVLSRAPGPLRWSNSLAKSIYFLFWGLLNLGAVIRALFTSRWKKHYCFSLKGNLVSCQINNAANLNFGLKFNRQNIHWPLEWHRSVQYTNRARNRVCIIWFLISVIPVTRQTQIYRVCSGKGANHWVFREHQVLIPEGCKPTRF